jgi:hypothetical protein
MKAMWICVPLACLAGCSWMRAIDPLACQAAKCVVVKVNDCDSSTGTLPDDDPLVFDPPRRVPKLIEWRISQATPNFEFVHDSITVVDGGTTFVGGSVGGNGKKFTLTNLHNHTQPQTAHYKYIIKVRSTGSSPRDCKPLDPFISNK